jgi:hypothetical protein
VSFAVVMMISVILRYQAFNFRKGTAMGVACLAVEALILANGNYCQTRLKE